MSNEYPGGVSTAEAAAGFAKVAEAMAESNTAPVMPEAVTLEELEAAVDSRTARTVYEHFHKEDDKT